MSFKNFFARTKVRAIEAAPAAGIAVGIAGIAGTAVLASRSTLKIDTVMTRHKEQINDLNRMYELRKLSDEDIAKEVSDPKYIDYVKSLDPDKYSQMHFGVWINTSVRFLKLYSPAISVGVASAALIIASHRTMSNRLSAAVSAYTVLQQTFEAYRKKAAETFGEDEVKEMEATNFFGAPDQDGRLNEKLPMMEKQSKYRIFNESNPRYSYDDVANRQFLSTQQNYFNDMLNARGYVFLNEVYKALGFQETPEGQLLGWLKYKPEDWSVHNGYIDFGVFDTEDLDDRLAHDHLTDNIRLDFNIDGMIYKKI